MAFWVATKVFFSKLNLKLILLVVAIIAVIVLGFSIYQSGVNAEKSANQIEDLKEEVAQSNANIENLKKNVVTVDDIQNLQQTTVRTQYEIRERVRNVPVLAEDRPFVADPGMLDRADIMRSHQESYATKQ